MAAFDATVVITTKDRRDELRRALESAVAQRGAAVEVLVVDDGSSDGTAAMVAEEFPRVRLVSHGASRGLIGRRNEATALARGAIVVHVDDDAVLSSEDTVRVTVAEFDDPQVGAVAIPYVDVLHGPRVHQRAPAPGVWAVDTFRGTAHALRRDVFLRLGGFREDLESHVEEPEYCLRLLDAGFVVRLGSATPIRHYDSPRRSPARNQHRIWRNNLVRAWSLVPLPWLPGRVAKIVVAGLLAGRREGQLRATVTGLASGLGRAPSELLRHRHPVERRTYRVERRLRYGGPIRLSEIRAELPPPAPATHPEEP
ncbi:glycosyltransferase [Patulibacter brassicae]|uniref:Glycosyltransferase n=1 Tax=Patulibacter brassicae TaxID=1705717 RepID=A0ABU4VKR0_9ACTN|nr:glycosyltransferase [Patulibacter brassicae]MDX8151669.1 glycosyltransferase [Patulibacter brassicae]